MAILRCIGSEAFPGEKRIVPCGAVEPIRADKRVESDQIKPAVS
jgi:hypothetical protein